MPVDAVLIQQPAIDFATFLGLTHTALGYSPASASDATRRPMSDAERFISCLEALRDPKATAGLRLNLLTHVSFSVLIAADERDVVEILECAAGMPFVGTETVRRDVRILVVTGTLAQWRDAVVTGSNAKGAAQACYCKIMGLFEAAGLNVWSDCKKKQTADPRLFLLEYHR